MLHVTQAITDEDCADLQALLVAYERYLPADLRHGSEPTLDEVRARYRAPNAAFLASVDGAAAGCVAMMRVDDTTASLQRLFVDPAVRRAGAGRALVRAVVERARAQGYRRLALDTHKSQLAGAYGLYVSLGFVECEPAYRAEHTACATFMELALP